MATNDPRDFPLSILHPSYQPYSKNIVVSPESLKKCNSLLPFNNLDLLSQKFKYKCAIEICRIPPERRTIEEVQIFVKNTETMQYFQEINRKNINKSEKIHERICVVLRYEFKRKGEIVFNAEEKANKFFIILSGSVNILVPKTQSNIIKEKNDSLKLKKNVFRSQKLKADSSNVNCEESLDEEERVTPEKPSMKARFDQVIHKYHDLLGGLGFYDIKSTDVDHLFDEGILKFNYYNTLKEGQTFGELGLLTGKLRSASVICKEDSHFGVMMEEDYKTIVAVIERKRIYDKFEFFKKYLIKDVPYEVLRKLSYSFEKNKFRRMQYIFKEGEECKSVFLIKKGEVQIQKDLLQGNDEKSLKTIGKKLPLKSFIPKKKKILLSILSGEFFGEDELMDTKLTEKEEKYIRKFSALVTSSKASIYVCPLIFFKKVLLERHSFYSKFLEKYIIKKEIREKQMENVHQQENILSKYQQTNILKPQELSERDEEKPFAFKKSLKDYKQRLKTLDNISSLNESSSMIFDLLNPTDITINNKVLMIPIGFTRKDEKIYENSIFSKIKYLNSKSFLSNNNSNEKTQINVLDEDWKTKAMIKLKVHRKKNKSDINLIQKFQKYNNDSYFSIKTLSNRHFLSRNLDKVDIALLNNGKNDFDLLGGNVSEFNHNTQAFMNIQSISDKKLSFFPKISKKI